MTDNVYRSIDVIVPANSRRRLERLSGFLKILNSNLDEFNIRIGNDSEGIAFQGFGIRVLQDFVELEIINNNASQLEITIGLSKAEIFDDRVNVTGTIDIEVGGNADPSNPAANVTSSAGNLLLAATSTRKYFEIYNNSSETLIVAGDDNTATTGMYILPGGYYRGEYTSAVYGLSGGATITNTDIGIIEVTK